MDELLAEPARETPIRYACDVLVAGGGLSGVCAAVSAARAGARVLLIEQTQMLGGVATAGLMASFTNRFIASDGTQVVRGIAGEVIDRLVEAGGARPNWRRPEVPQLPLDPELLQLVLIRLLRDAGVEVILGTMAVSAPRGDDEVVVAVENRAGRQAIRAKAVVDATGEATMAAFMGGCHAETPAASASLEFRMAGVDLAALFDYFRRHPDDFATDHDQVTAFEDFERNWTELGILHLPHGGGRLIRPLQDAIAEGRYARERGLAHGLDALGVYANANTDTIIVNSNFYTIDGVDPIQISRAVLDARERCFETGQLLKEALPGFEQAYVVQTAPELGVRISRWIEGETTLTRAALETGQEFDDVIAMQRRVQALEHADGSVPGVSEMPCGILIPRGVTRLVVASGKTASTEPRGLLRGQVACMALGHAAGVAAALAAQGDTPPSQVPPQRIQRELLRQGAYLGSGARLRELGLR
jgi:hypothetical protein